VISSQWGKSETRHNDSNNAVERVAESRAPHGGGSSLIKIRFNGGIQTRLVTLVLTVFLF
jgi:hypothetical protein